MKALGIGAIALFLSTHPASSLAADRYALLNTHDKLVQNDGSGYENLYGTRNFRAVLPNLMYRGGGNNLGDKDRPRANMNPLPLNGLNSLCEEGFDTAVYMYTDNFDADPHTITCIDRRTNLTNTLTYLQVSPFEEPNPRALLQIVFQKIKKSAIGPTAPAYFHCWNGWHASGMISALALEQFCGLSGNDAYAYWDLNRDQMSLPQSSELKIQNLIKNFVPFEDLKISAEDRARVCF